MAETVSKLRRQPRIQVPSRRSIVRRNCRSSSVRRIPTRFKAARDAPTRLPRAVIPGGHHRLVKIRNRDCGWLRRSVPEDDVQGGARWAIGIGRAFASAAAFGSTCRSPESGGLSGVVGIGTRKVRADRRDSNVIPTTPAAIERQQRKRDPELLKELVTPGDACTSSSASMAWQPET